VFRDSRVAKLSFKHFFFLKLFSQIFPAGMQKSGYSIKLFQICVKKKVIVFPVPSRGMSLTKLSLAGNNLTIPSQGEFG
jgi:hypothetical protein